jgi:tRNA (guanine-N7-)-methyltransferase
MDEAHGEIRSYVIRSGRMTDLQKAAYSELSKKHCIAFDPATKLASLVVFGNENPLIVEIGFGMGFATAQIAEASQEKNFIGIEVHKPGIGKLLSEIEKRKIPNLRIIEHDAVETIGAMIPDTSVQGFNIFFPDPWPKKRHHKRRILRGDFAALLSRKLLRGGYIYFVTDWEEYAAAALDTLSSCQGLRNAHESFSPRREWRPLTKFELRANKDGRMIRELYFMKI